MALPSNRLRDDLRNFLAVVLLLNLVGLVFIYSSSSVFALEKHGAAHYFLKKQLFYLIPSLLGFWLPGADSHDLTALFWG
jgi:cell division protein FtsW (lipid II flippase)